MKWRLIPHFRKRGATSWDILAAVIEAIREEPARVDMDTWLNLTAEWGRSLPPSCGTVGCIAGWMATITAPSRTGLYSSEVENRALDLLPPSLRLEAAGLFVGAPPYCFPSSPDGSKADQRRYAREVIANIRLFMNRHKAELKAFRPELPKRAAHV